MRRNLKCFSQSYTRAFNIGRRNNSFFLFKYIYCFTVWIVKRYQHYYDVYTHTHTNGFFLERRTGSRTRCTTAVRVQKFRDRAESRCGEAVGENTTRLHRTFPRRRGKKSRRQGSGGNLPMTLNVGEKIARIYGINKYKQEMYRHTFSGLCNVMNRNVYYTPFPKRLDHTV